jgi:hypothetical protein
MLNHRLQAWKRHSKVVRDVLQRNLPLGNYMCILCRRIFLMSIALPEEFAALSRKLFHQMDLAIKADQGKSSLSKKDKEFGGGCVRWEDLTMRYTLDAVGK